MDEAGEGEARPKNQSNNGNERQCGANADGDTSMDSWSVAKSQESLPEGRFKVAFKAGPNLQTILSKKNKVKLPPNSNPGVYMIPCPCGVPPYVGKTKLRTCTRLGQHQEYISKEQWERSGAAQHARTCPAGPDFANATMLKTEGRHFERSVRETLEIQRHRSAPKFGGMNQDEGQYVKTSFWMPFMDTITKEECEREEKSIRRREREMHRTHERNQNIEPSDVTIIDMTSNP